MCMCILRFISLHDISSEEDIKTLPCHSMLYPFAGGSLTNTGARFAGSES